MITVGGMSSLEINPPNHLRISQTTDRTVPVDFPEPGLRARRAGRRRTPATSTWCRGIAATRCRPRTSGTSTCSASCRGRFVARGRLQRQPLENNWRSIDGNPAPPGPGQHQQPPPLSDGGRAGDRRRRSRCRTSRASRRTAGASITRCRRRSRSATRTASRCSPPTRGRGRAALEGGYQDFNNIAAEVGAGDDDRPHHFVASGVYELPFGRDRRFGERRGGGWVNAAARRLERQPDPDAHLGRAAQPHRQRQSVELERHRSAERRRRLASSTTRPSIAGSTPTAFVANAPFTFGNAPRNLLRGPGYVNLDLVLRKSFRLSTRVTADLRFESFNVTNAVNFGNPNTQVGNPNFGRISSAGSRAQQPDRRQAAVLDPRHRRDDSHDSPLASPARPRSPPRRSAPAALAAHHAFAAEFDANKPVTLEGHAHQGRVDQPARLDLRRRQGRGRQGDQLGGRVRQSRTRCCGAGCA